MILPKILIILVNWNTSDTTIECIESIKSTDYNNYEIIIVDNGSLDVGELESFIIEKHPDISLIKNEKNLGYAGGNNKGIELAIKMKADYILLLNNDTIVDRCFLKELVDYAEIKANIAVLNPKIYYYKPSDLVWFAGSTGNLWTGCFKHIGKGRKDRSENNIPRETAYATGCAFFMKVSVIKEIGMLDDNFFAYSEDLDWSLRAKKAGYKCMYVPNSKIWHMEAVSITKNMSKANKGRTTPFQIYLYYRNKLFIMRKHCAFFQRITYFVVLLCLEILPRMIGFIVLNRWEKLKSLNKGFYEGLTAEV